MINFAGLLTGLKTKRSDASHEQEAISTDISLNSKCPHRNVPIQRFRKQFLAKKTNDNGCAEVPDEELELKLGLPRVCTRSSTKQALTNMSSVADVGYMHPEEINFISTTKTRLLSMASPNQQMKLQQPLNKLLSDTMLLSGEEPNKQHQPLHELLPQTKPPHLPNFHSLRRLMTKSVPPHYWPLLEQPQVQPQPQLSQPLEVATEFISTSYAPGDYQYSPIQGNNMNRPRPRLVPKPKREQVQHNSDEVARHNLKRPWSMMQEPMRELVHHSLDVTTRNNMNWPSPMVQEPMREHVHKNFDRANINWPMREPVHCNKDQHVQEFPWIEGNNSNGGRGQNWNIEMNKMPSVTTFGFGPDGKKIEGFLYKLHGETAIIICNCHGHFFTPAEFVRHAGWPLVDNPMKLISVSLNPFAN